MRLVVPRHKDHHMRIERNAPIAPAIVRTGCLGQSRIIPSCSCIVDSCKL